MSAADVRPEVASDSVTPPPTARSASQVQRTFEASTEEGRAFLQERIAAFTRAMFLLMCGVMAFVAFARKTGGVPDPDPTARYISLGILVVMVLALGNMSRIASGKLRSERFVRVLDIGCTLDPAFLLAVVVYVMREVRLTQVATTTILIFIVLGRALIIPSTARHTLVVSVLSFAPMILSVVYVSLSGERYDLFPPSIAIGGVLLWAVATTALATYGSHIIYGLRQEIREAQQLGQYTLLEKIGEGGMGSVYRARHAMLRRPTAIKLVPPEKAGPQQLVRFEREVQHTAELQHPNTIQIFDYGHSPDGVFYYAMEFLDGIDLDDLVERDGPQPPGRVVHILEQACAALAEAHAKGLVHRDIKPANMFLCHRGGIPDVVKVLDFGLVKELATEGGVTNVDVVAGTPAYLSPEAITAPDTLGPSADIYALGAVGYFLLTGEPVFSGATVVEICGHHVHSAPEPPSRRSPLTLSDDLEAVILRCLAKKPEERPPDVRELRRALRSLPESTQWDDEQAEAWWAEAPRKKRSGAGTGAPETMDIDLRARA